LQFLIPWPYDEIYRWYLGMKICDANGETTKYANEAAKYNSLLSRLLQRLQPGVHAEAVRDTFQALRR